MKNNLIFVLGLGIVILLTNRWIEWNQAIELVSAGDVSHAYEKIAKIAPAFLTESLPFHHTQRFFIHYVVGCVSKFFDLQLYSTYLGAVLACITIVVLVFHFILKHLEVSNTIYRVCMGILFFSPYTFRYYLLVPGMSADLVFILGVALLVLGLLKVFPIFIFLGMAVSLLGRPTLLLGLPVILSWTFLEPSWKYFNLKNKIILSFIFLLWCFVFLKFVNWFAVKISPGIFPEVKGYTIFSFFVSSEFNIVKLLIHYLRIFVPFLLLGFLFFRHFLKNKKNLLFWLHVFLGLSIVAQPFFTNPNTVIGNGARLSTLGVVPIIVALGLFLRNATKFSNKYYEVFFFIFLFLFSLHHLYSWLGPFSVNSFAIWYTLLAFCCALTFKLRFRSN